MKTKMRVLITGATGLVGTQIGIALLSKGYELVILGRRDEKSFRQGFSLPCEYHQWADPNHAEPPSAALTVDFVINLMGEPIGEKRWSEAQKKKIYDSRVAGTRNLVNALHKAKVALQAFVSASAIGYYGEDKDSIFTESSPAAPDFLGIVCRDWEVEALKAPGRVVLLRTGIGLAGQGGALEKMVPLFENGVGGRLGKGDQWMSWIHLDDLVRVYIEALENPQMKGAYNAVAPTPVTNKEFTETLAQKLKVSAFLPVPRLALKLALGEMAQIILVSQRVDCKALKDLGFKFNFETLENCLQDLFSWKESRHDRMYQALQWVPETRKSVFSYFSDEKNLEALTPEFLNFHVLKKSSEQIKKGTIIDYKLRIHGVPALWKTEITLWNPDHEFKDFQLKGPYKKWDHTHTFEDLAGGTLLRDRVIFRLPFASLGGNAALPLVAKDIREIFKFRKQKITELFS